MKWEDVRDGLEPAGLFRWHGDPGRDLATEAEAAGWKTWRLDTAGVQRIGDFYAKVRVALDLPPWFGDNLDALFDALRDAVAGPSVLVWDGSHSIAQIGEDFTVGVVTALRDAVADTEALAVILRDDPLAELAEGLE